ncbi:MAG: hypothetical protein ACR2IK_06065 [Chloroflexota bacterium]
MQRNDPELDQLLFRLLDAYGDEGTPTADPATAAGDVLHVLRTHAAGLLAEPGRFQAVLTLATEDVPLLGGVEAQHEGLHGLRQIEQEAGLAATQEAITAVLVRFLGFLRTLLGPPAIARLVAESQRALRRRQTQRHP